MKKILIHSLVILGAGCVLLGYTNESFAYDCQSGYTQNADESGCTKNASSTETTIFTSEMVPGAECKCVYANDVGADNADGSVDAPATAVSSANGVCSNTVPVAKRKYQCTIKTGLAGFQQIFAQIIRWVINIVLLLGVLAVVGLGIAWSFAGGDDIKAKSTLKKWAVNIIIGLIILFFFRYILQFLAPWVYQ